MKALDLKPCPMCQSEAYITVERLWPDSFFPNIFSAKWKIACKHCGVKLESNVSYELKEGAVVESVPGVKNLIDKWNRRAKDENA